MAVPRAHGMLTSAFPLGARSHGAAAAQELYVPPSGNLNLRGLVVSGARPRPRAASRSFRLCASLRACHGATLRLLLCLP